MTAKPTKFQFWSVLSEVGCDAYTASAFGDVPPPVEPGDSWFVVNGMRVRVPTVDPLPLPGARVRVTIDWSGE